MPGFCPITARQFRNLPGSDREFSEAIPMAWPTPLQIERAKPEAYESDLVRKRGATWRLSRPTRINCAARTKSMSSFTHSKAIYRTAWKSAIGNSTPLPSFLVMSWSRFCPTSGVSDSDGRPDALAIATTPTHVFQVLFPVRLETTGHDFPIISCH